MWLATRQGRRAEAAFDARVVRGADGVVVGAESILLRGTTGRAVLLLHGFNDTPQSLRSMAEAFHASGWTVSAPLLPGHGRSLEAFAASDRRQWLRATSEAFATLRLEHDAVVVGGLSMGGALATLLAAREPAVRALLLFAPMLAPTWLMRLVAWFGWLSRPFVRYIANRDGERSVRDPVARDALIAYRVTTPTLVRELRQLARDAHRALPRVHAPTFYAQSVQDNRLSARMARRAFERLGCRDRTLHWLTGAGHVITADYGHAALAALAVSWAEKRVTPAPSASPPA